MTPSESLLLKTKNRFGHVTNLTTRNEGWGFNSQQLQIFYISEKENGCRLSLALTVMHIVFTQIIKIQISL